MNKLLRDIPFFMEVARQRSFTAAADILKMPLSTLSRRIAAMEKNLGVLLLHRTTRSVELTESGKIFFESCGHILVEMEHTQERILRNLQKPSGKIRMSLVDGIYHVYMGDLLSSFAALYPDIELHVYCTTRRVDLNADPFDLEICGGEQPDSDLKMRRLSTVYPALYASPALLERHDPPKTPADLKKMPFISLVASGKYSWEMHRGDEVEIIPSLRTVHLSNTVSVCLEFALKGLGVALLIPPLAEQFEQSGQLVRVLPDWQATGADICVVMPTGNMPYRIRLFVDYLAEYFAALPK